MLPSELMYRAYRPLFTISIQDHNTENYYKGLCEFTDVMLNNTKNLLKG